METDTEGHGVAPAQPIQRSAAILSHRAPVVRHGIETVFTMRTENRE